MCIFNWIWTHTRSIWILVKDSPGYLIIWFSFFGGKHEKFVFQFSVVTFDSFLLLLVELKVFLLYILYLGGGREKVSEKTFFFVNGINFKFLKYFVGKMVWNCFRPAYYNNIELTFRVKISGIVLGRTKNCFVVEKFLGDVMNFNFGFWFLKFLTVTES